MLQEVRKLEQELKLAPIHMDMFGDNLLERAKSIRHYLLGLIDIAKTNNKKEKAHG
jgi:hypothetical protein